MTVSVADDQCLSAYTFFVPGQPCPQPRMTRYSKYGKDKHGQPTSKARAIERYLAWKETIGWTATNAGVRPLSGPVCLHVRVSIPNRMKRPWDISNVLKAAEDALNGIAYADDAQVTSATIRVYTAGQNDVGTSFWVGEVE